MYQSYMIATQPQRDRFGFFRSLVDSVFCPMDVESRLQSWQTFGGRVEATKLGSTGLALVSTSACTVRRRPVDIQQLTEAPYLIKFQAKGESIWTQRGRDVHLRPGDFVVSSTAEPYTLRFLDAYEMPVMTLSPQTMRRLTADPDQFLGVRFSGDEADCGLLSRFVSDVVARMNALQEPMISRIESNILNLLGGVLCARARHGLISAEQKLSQIKTYIADHLHDRELSPATVAASFRISVRQLHALFESEPVSVGRYIRRCRVEACRRALLAESAMTVSLTDLALSWGFYDLSHMTRSFREEFGVTPTDYRVQHRLISPTSA